MYEFSMPTKIIFGEGTVNKIGELLPGKEAPSNVLLVTGSSKWRAGLNEKIMTRLTGSGWKEVFVFDEIKENPTHSSVKKGIKLCRDCSAEAIVAVGGGSPMDASKIMAKEAGVDLLVTIPTTAGSGSEISPWAVITNEATREKQSLIGKIPTVAILDPVLTLSLPPKSTLFTGLDAFTHGLEAYLSKSANSITDAMALDAIQLLAKNLSKVLENPQDMEARSKMLEGNLLAGIAMLHSGLGLIHAIANTVGGLYHELEHGLIIGALIRNVNEFNIPANPDRYQKIEEFTKIVESSMEKAIRQISIPEIKIREKDLDLLFKRSMNNVNAYTNPRDFSLTDIKNIVINSFSIV